MDATNNQDETAQADPHAWRRKPRKWAPKSRLGCKTCKIRRVKCDLAQPSCKKCTSTGRTCDGYNEPPPVSRLDAEPAHQYGNEGCRAAVCDSDHPWTMIQGSIPQQRQAEGHGLSLYNPGPFMTLPVTGSVQGEAMSFFKHISVKHLDEYRPSDSWRNTLMYFSETVPAVQHAATALALIQLNGSDRDALGRAKELADKSPLYHYNRAIQLVLNQEAGNSTETTAVTLLVCYLFNCFDQLAGNYDQAMKHLRGGVELSRTVERAASNTNNTSANAEAHTLLLQVTRQIRRLDMQAVAFLVDWTPVDIQETVNSLHLSSGCAFQSLEDAADHLQTLIARVMRLRYAHHGIFIECSDPSLTSVHVTVVLGQLDLWSRLFESMLLQRGDPRENIPQHSDPLVSLLRLQYTLVWILLRCCGPQREMDYDAFLPQFQRCVALAGDVAAAHEQYSGPLRSTYTPDVGIVPVLFMVGAKCRHPAVRREVLGILRRRTIREAVWDSMSAARVVERLIEIEESREAGEGRTVQSMAQIPFAQRVEDVTWTAVHGPSATRVDICYVFCARDGEHVESLRL